MSDVDREAGCFFSQSAALLFLFVFVSYSVGFQIGRFCVFAAFKKHMDFTFALSMTTV